MPTKRKPSKYYVDNKKFHAAMKEYITAYRKAAAENKEPPRIPMYIGECFMKIATHLAHKPNFANYPFKEDMISDAVETCCKYLHNYDPDNHFNPFAYFTTTVGRAFVQRIQKEKLYLYKKHAATEMAKVTNQTSEVQEHDVRKYHDDLNQGEWSEEQMHRFMEDFEQGRKRRRKKVVTE